MVKGRHYNKNKYQRRQKLQNEEEYFNWSKLPPELKLIVINKMELKSKLRFSQCSKGLRQIIKNLRNIIYQIEISDTPHRSRKIKISHNKFASNSETNSCDYWIEFEKLKGKRTRVTYRLCPISSHQSGVVKWEQIEDGNTKQTRLRYLNYYLKEWANACTSFYFDSGEIKLVNVNLNMMKKLEELKFGYNIRFDSFIINSFLSREKLMNLRILTILWKNRMEFEEIKNFQGKELQINCHCFYESHFNSLFMRLKNGEILPNINKFKLYGGIENYSFDMNFNVLDYLLDLNVIGFRRSEERWEEEENGEEEEEEILVERPETYQFSMRNLHRGGKFDVKIFFDTGNFKVEILWNESGPE